MGAIKRCIFKTGTALAFAAAGYMAAKVCYNVGKVERGYWASRAKDLNLSFDEAVRYKADNEKLSEIILGGGMALLVLAAMSVPAHEATKLRHVLEWQNENTFKVHI